MKKTAIILIAVLFAAGFYYFILGGGESLNWEIRGPAEYTLSAEYFQGPYYSSELERVFQKAKAHALERGNPMVVVNLGSDQYAARVYQWIGLLTDKPVDDPLYREFTLDASHRITTRITTHNFAMPTPETVRQQALEAADSLNWQTADFTLELYYPDGTVEVVVPAEEAR